MASLGMRSCCSFSASARLFQLWFSGADLVTLSSPGESSGRVQTDKRKKKCPSCNEMNPMSVKVRGRTILVGRTSQQRQKEGHREMIATISPGVLHICERAARPCAGMRAGMLGCNSTHRRRRTRCVHRKPLMTASPFRCSAFARYPETAINECTPSVFLLPSRGA